MAEEQERQLAEGVAELMKDYVKEFSSLGYSEAVKEFYNKIDLAVIEKIIDRSC